MSRDIEGPEEHEEAVDERPQQRREWSGPMRSIVLPLAAVAAIVGVIWAIEQRNDGAEVAGDTGIVESEPGAEADEGKPAPDFVLEAIEGGSVRLSDYGGRPVFVNFWATWCKPCRQEIPEMVEAFDRYAGEGLVIIAINVQESRDAAQGFVDEFGMDFPVGLDVRGDVAEAYRVLGLPTSFFIDRNGVIQAIHRGPLNADQMDDRLQEIL
ncbi:MAG TPA: redoxin domain-containing protein [Dehalococcoidia bacterium]|nr:redoxin domain-containing protein [Dehalococcoidia bacterium]